MGLCLAAAGGLGHLGVQYAAAMGLRTIALDVGQAKLVSQSVSQSVTCAGDNDPLH